MCAQASRAINDAIVYYMLFFVCCHTLNGPYQCHCVMHDHSRTNESFQAIVSGLRGHGIIHP